MNTDKPMNRRKVLERETEASYVILMKSERSPDILFFGVLVPLLACVKALTSIFSSGLAFHCTHMNVTIRHI
jgi:hypothetical protein